MGDIADRLRALADEVAALESAQPPAPAPAPDPAPAPPPAGDEPLPIHSQPIDLSRLVCFVGWHESSRYERYQRMEVWRGERAQVQAIGISISAGGVGQPLLSPAYTLIVDGVEVASAAPVGPRVTWEVDLSAVPPGWHTLNIGGLSGGETCPTWFAWREGGAVADLMPVCTGSFDLAKGSPLHYWAWLPTRYKPQEAPLPGGPYTPFADAVSEQSLRADPMVPGCTANIVRPSITREGVVCTFNNQSYFWGDLIRDYPRLHLLDGPRGVGSVGMVTHISIGKATQTADPASAPRLTIYACDPWRLMRIEDDGAVTTLAGYRHRGMASQYQSQPGATLELVGDWSAVPEDRRGFHELWGMAWDSDTLPVGGEPIDGREPHLVGPVCVLADTQRNRLARLEFNPRGHNPPRVTEFATGLSDPWDVVEWRGEWIVSERTAHRITAIDKRTGARRLVLQGQSLANVDKNRVARRTVSLDAARAAPCVAPEGLYVLGDWLYFGSLAQADVRRVHLETGAFEVVCYPYVDGNSSYLKIAVSDGTFGPAGTVFAQTWSNAKRADERAHLPDGSHWRLPGGSRLYHGGYGAAVAVGGGRMYTGSSDEGIVRYSLGQQWDAALYAQGRDEYFGAGLQLLHGQAGISPYGYVAPRGISAAIDHFLTVNGA